MTLFRPLFAAGAAAVVAAPLAAQTRADTARLPDLVVTATRAPAPVTALPAATTVLDGDALRARGIRFVTDALREVPGIAIVQNGSYGAVTSLFLRGGESDYVKVLLDGVPLNAPGGSINLANLTTDDLDRIEIVRGPASVLYGADAMSGVVQLFTRRGGGRVHGEVGGRGGSFGTDAFDARLAAGRGAFSASVAGSRFASDGLYDFNSAYRNSVGSLALGWAGANGARATATVRYGDAKAHFPTDFAGVPSDRNQYTTDRGLALGVAATVPAGRAVTLAFSGFASRLRPEFDDAADTPADTNGYGFAGTRRGTTWRRGGDARLDWRARPSALLSLGVGLEREEEEQTSSTTSNFGTGVFTEDAAFQADRTTRNVFGQFVGQPHERVTVQIGGRLDDNSAFGTFVTGRAGFTLQIAPATRLWAAAGNAFKAPTFAELFAATAFEVGNPGLDPERSVNLEVGVTQALGRASLRVAAFRQRFRDLIQYVGADPGEANYINLGAAESRGVEAVVTAELTPRIGMRVHGTWLRTEVTDTGAVSSPVFRQGEALIRRPELSGGVTLTARVGAPVVSATLGYVGERDDVDYASFPAARTTLPSYATVDLAVDAPLRRAGNGLPGIDLTLRGENLFDAGFEQTVGYPGRGRTLFAGGRLRF